MGNSGQTNLKILWAAGKETTPKVRNQASLPRYLCHGAQKRERNPVKFGGVLGAFGGSFCLTWKPQPWQKLGGAFQTIVLAVAPGVRGRQLTITPFVFFFMFDSQMRFWSALVYVRMCSYVYIYVQSQIYHSGRVTNGLSDLLSEGGWFTHYSIKCRGSLSVRVVPCSFTKHIRSCGTVKL